MLLCQREQMLRAATCEVLSSTPLQRGYRLHLRDSVLYPEGGGQPCDLGTIAGVQVTDVQKAPQGGVFCYTDEPVEPGPAEVIVDWERRFDLMQQHSAQHLLTALADRRLGAPTKAFHLGVEYAAIELETPSFGADKQAQLLEWANEAIREARPIRWHELTPEEYQRSGARSRLLPADHDGNYRLIEIEGIDLNTCGGIHVPSTAALQGIGFLGLERTRKRWRLSFVAGGRLLRYFHTQVTRASALNQLLNAAPSEHVARVTHLLDELHEARRKTQDAFSALGQTLAQLASTTDQRWTHHHQEGADLKQLEAIAQGFCRHASTHQALFLTASEPDANHGVFLLAGPPLLLQTAGPMIATTMDGRGGGRPGRFQGKVNQIHARQQALTLLQNLPAP